MSVRSDRVLSDYFKQMAQPDAADSLSVKQAPLETAERLLQKAQEALHQEALNQQVQNVEAIHQAEPTLDSNNVATNLTTLKISTENPVEQDLVTEKADKEIRESADIQEKNVEATFIPLEKRLPNRFQALFFEVAGLTLALPLIELGGIHEIKNLTPLPGKASYQLGVFVKNDEKFQCIDTSQVVMPEKVTATLSESLNYRYGVQLGKTQWILACEALKDTDEITQEQVNWRSQSNSRQWLAGMIKDKMCALIDAERLVDLLHNRVRLN